MKDFFHIHADKILEIGALIFIFVFGAIMLAAFPKAEEMGRWIEGGVVVVALARAFGTHGGSSVNNSGLNNSEVGNQKPAESGSAQIGAPGT